MDVMEAIKGRRSIRSYKPDPISDEELETVLEAARWAPSWGNTQCWRFVIVKDAEIKAKLADTLAEGNPAAPAIRNAPVVIAACARVGLSGRGYGGAFATQKGDWYMFDVGLAMANLTLAAHSLGLGTVHVGLLDEDKAAEVLGVPENYVLVELMPLGHPDESPAPTSRRELSEIVFRDRYGQR